MLFRAFPGFQEVRPAPGHNAAFVDFQKGDQAGKAMMAMQGIQAAAQAHELSAEQKEELMEWVHHLKECCQNLP